jgi:ABC-type molybdenum transport system ATPase subunit/photorepair protein PhrA
MTFVPQKDKMRVMQQNLLEIKNCRIQRGGTIFVPEIDWSMKTGESWLVLGPNGGGKADFVKALAGIYEFVPCGFFRKKRGGGFAGRSGGVNRRRAEP